MDLREIHKFRFLSHDNSMTLASPTPSRALVGVKNKEGKSIFDGKKVTCFSNFEEEQVDKVKVSPIFLLYLSHRPHTTYFQEIPFLVESRLVSLGGKYEKASDPWAVSTSTPIFSF